MSKFLKPPHYQGRGLENSWLNIVYQSHDQICSCNTVIDHLNHIIDQQKCHRSTEKDTTAATTGTGEQEEMPFDAEDLERLFSESQDAEG